MSPASPDKRIFQSEPVWTNLSGNFLRKTLAESTSIRLLIKHWGRCEWSATSFWKFQNGKCYLRWNYICESFIVRNNAIQRKDAIINTTEQKQSEYSDVFVVIPMLNEEESIGPVLGDLPPVSAVIVVDNGSEDSGPDIAKQHGATVVFESQRGYGKACLTGIAKATELIEASGRDDRDPVIVFLDADYSDYPNEMPLLVDSILRGEHDFVIGSRARGERESGAMPFQAVFGNWLACSLVRLFWGVKFTDLGPFRAIRFRSLQALGMVDENFGWTIEMQIKAIKAGLRIDEVPVSYRRRVGISKISGTVSGTIRAGYKIIYTIFKYRFLTSK